DLEHRTLLPLLRLVGALLQPSIDDDAHALSQGICGVLCGLAPHIAGEEQCLTVLVLAGVPVVDAGGGGDSEVRDGGTCRRETQDRIFYKIADDGDGGISLSHDYASSCSVYAAAMMCAGLMTTLMSGWCTS